MNYLFTNFRRFFEEIDTSIEKMSNPDGSDDTPTGSDYFDTLEDEFGINWKSLKKVFSSEPWISSHFLLGKPNKEVAYKISAWEVDPETITEKGALIRMKPVSGGDRTYLKGGILTKTQDDNYYYLSKDELVKFLTTGWTPPAAPAGDMGGGGDVMGGIT